MNKTIEQTNEQSLNNFFDDIGTAPMTRIPYVKRLLFCWWKWRNLSRNKLPPQLDMNNDRVDSSRKSSDLINAASCDFAMFRLDRIIKELNPTLRAAVFALYGHAGMRGVIHAADELGISKSTMIRRLCRADQAIAMELDAIRNKEKSC